ncbi:MAG: FKBP-type peptidyl-prolyl cis-trans isomerase [Bacteroidota bacterium]
MKALLSALACILLLWSCGKQVSVQQEMNSQTDSVSYALGMDIARFYEKQTVPLNPDLVFLGMRDVLQEDGTPRFSNEEAAELITAFQQVLAQKQSEDQQRLAAENDIRGRMFLQTNKTKDGVIELPSGLQYKVLSTGVGAPPTASNVVKVSYQGRLQDGTIFETSEDAGGTVDVGVTEVIPGWTEALLMMKPGDKWELFIPPDLAYGSAGRLPTIAPNSIVIFELELQEIVR